MSSSSLAAYLAKNYLTADPAPSKPKKKKRKHASENTLVIADDDTSWGSTPKPTTNDDDSAPIIVGGPAHAPARTTKTNWIITDESASSDAIIAANLPSQTSDDDPAIVKMESGAHAGLQTGEQVAAQLAAAKRAELARFAAEDPTLSGKGQDTIYRDASGRIINIAMARAEARAAQRAEEEKEARVRETRMGEVQKREAARRKEDLREARYMGFARYQDDEEMNREMREREVWNDPAAAFMTTTKKAGGGKVYSGAAEPNRFGIRPGHRWDGVDRGNGFERRWFQAQNRRREKVERSYTSQMDID